MKGKTYEIAFALNGKIGNSFNKTFNSAQKNFSGISKSISGMATAALGAVGVSVTAGAAFSEAMNMEGFRMQLETATKSAEKAGETMQWAVELANKTPFETGEMVEASARLEAMGLSAQKYLPMIGDMAGATNKDLIQATEAIIDAQTGELERMKEFGIKKADIVQYAYENMGKMQVVNNKGQITNQEKFNEALLALMDGKFKGGMEKQASTMKGLMSTVSGILKSGMTTMLGITSQGVVTQGSLYDTVKGKIKEVANTLTEWQTNGTFQAIGSTITNTLGDISSMASFIFQAFNGDIKTSTFDAVVGIMERLGVSSENASAIISSLGSGIGNIKSVISGVVNVAKGLFEFITSNWTTITPIIMSIVGGMVAFKTVMVVGGAAMSAYNIAMKGWTIITQAQTIAQGALNLAMSVSPVTWLALAIGALVATGVLLWKNWDTIKAKAFELWEGIKSAFGGLGEWFGGLWEGVKSTFKSFVNFIIGGLNKIPEALNKLNFTVPDWVPGLGGKSMGFNLPQIPQFYTGTTGYNTPDTFIAGERGPELVTNAPGYKVFNAGKTGSMLNRDSNDINTSGINVTFAPNITVNGNSDGIENEILKILKKYQPELVNVIIKAIEANARRNKALSVIG